MHRVICFPQLGQTITASSLSCSNKSTTPTPKAEAIFSKVSSVGFPLIDFLSPISVTPIFSARSLNRMPFSLQISLTRNFITYIFIVY